MAEYIESLKNLAENFGRLEGVGKKTAMRMAFSILELSKEEVEEFAHTVRRPNGSPRVEFFFCR